MLRVLSLVFGLPVSYDYLPPPLWDAPLETGGVRRPSHRDWRWTRSRQLCRLSCVCGEERAGRADDMMCLSCGAAMEPTFSFPIEANADLPPHLLQRCLKQIVSHEARTKAKQEAARAAKKRKAGSSSAGESSAAGDEALSEAE